VDPHRGDTRDQSIDRLLRRGAGAPPAELPSAGCFDGEALGAWTSGALSGDESARVEQHVADCARCQAMMATFVRTAPAPPQATPPWWRMRVRWLVPVATAAVVVAVWVAVPRSPERALPAPQPVTTAAPTAQRDDLQFRDQAELRATPTAPTPQQPPAAAAVDSTAARPLVGSATEKKASSQEQADASVRRERALSSAARAPIAGITAAPPPPSAAPQPVPAAPTASAPAALAESVAGNPQRPRAALVSGAEVFNVRAPDGVAAWRIVGGTRLQRSTDGGVEWRSIDFVPAAPLTAGHAPAGSILWLVGQRGVIYVSRDATTFERVPFVETADLVSVVAIDAHQATVTSSDGRTWRTSDGGSTWIRP
jgi:hypothetical protein